VGTRSRSNSLSTVPSTSGARESSGEATGDDPAIRIGASSEQPSGISAPSSPFTFLQLRRPLRHGERLLLTLLAEQCVDALLRQGQEKKEGGSADDEAAPGDRSPV